MALAADPAAASRTDAPAPPPDANAPSRPDPRRGSWTGPLREIVGRWKGRARAESNGRVSASDIQVSVHVRALGSDGGGVELASLDPDTPHCPASNLKLVTTAAALVLLGPHQEFQTPVEWSADVRDGVLQGDLVLRAAGDPIVAVDGDARVEARLDPIADALRRAGVHRIAGRVVLDEGTFPDPGPGPGWPDPSQYWQEHCALAGGFSINAGVLQARVRPGHTGASAHVEVHPWPTGLVPRLGVTTKKGKLDVRVGATRTTLTVRGSIPPDVPIYLPDFSHPDPVTLFGEVLEDRLTRAGIRVDGGVVRERGVPGAEALLALRSPLDGVLVPINTHSRNSVADQLFLALGLAIEGAGTRDAGADATRRALRSLGVPLDGFHQVDGSGLSRDNRVSARQLTALLAGVFARGNETERLFRESLAVAGRRGTLAKRMVGTSAEGHVQAKTGWIRGVSAISGFCEAASGELLAFSILVSYPPSADGLNTRIFKPMEDEMLVALSEADR